MKQTWLERLRETIADRGWDLLKLGNGAGRGIASMCRELLASGHGEAFLIALSREVLRAYEGLDPEARKAFFRTLATDYGPDLEGIRRHAPRFLESGDPEDLIALGRAVEARRQELFRRLNMSPHGTPSLVRMREDLLGLLPEDPSLRPVDADLRHLLLSWFNRGFLKMHAITWQTPAHVLEKLIRYESVHEIRGWDDLRRRLAGDRRCFAFFHPAMPDEPLIFVEVALCHGVQTAIGPLIEPGAPVLEPRQADTAVFYSINNTQAGLRGISFGNFLLKQVVEELRAELPRLRRFVTLSPLPRFARALRGAATGEKGALDPAVVRAILEEHRGTLGELSGRDSPLEGLLHLLDTEPERHHRALERPLRHLALAYLVQRGPRGLLDPVAGFHLANGARLEGVNPFADASPQGIEQSFGVMANYLYVPDEVVANHEKFMGQGEVAMSRPLARLRRRLPAAAEPARA